jgi:nucleotide-binding universal stress UspA family protein
MSIRNILAILTGADTDEGAAATAFLAAKRLSAHVTGLHVRADIIDELPFIEEHLSQEEIKRLYDAARKHLNKIERDAREQFDNARRAIGGEYTDVATGTGTITASWEVQAEEVRIVLGEFFEEVVTFRGRVSDLTVISPKGYAVGASGRRIVDRLLFESGRPVLLSPALAPVTLGEKALIAWNRSAQSARAVAAAMPMLEQCESVIIVYIETDAKDGPSPEELQASLRWHGVEAEVKRIPPGSGSVAEQIDAAASDSEADLLVMGAYFHSRLRELVLGGVTDYFLDHTRLPILMTH